MIRRHEREIECDWLQVKDLNVHLLAAGGLRRGLGDRVGILNVHRLVKLLLGTHATRPHKVIYGKEEVFVNLGRELLE